VTSSLTWPFDSQVAISYRCFIGTKSVSVAVVDIMSSKYIGVMTLTFLGHVTSSATWPFESQWAISYRRSIVTKSLSPAVLEILGPQHIGITTELAADFFTKDQWPPNSPDLNPVEYCVWGAMLEAYRKLKTKLKTIAGLRFRLSGATCHMDRSTRLWKDFSKWLITCVGNDAGHFEHSLCQ